MKVRESDMNWLARTFPNLYLDDRTQTIAGELDFHATYLRASEELKLGRNKSPAPSEIYLYDVFEVEIQLDTRLSDRHPWPIVSEIGGRRHIIEKATNASQADLHFFDKGACCLGIRFTPDKNLTIIGFFNQRIIPFFFRLSYIDKYGLDAANKNLWGEYSHGSEGYAEHLKRIFGYAQSGYSKYEPCPCGSKKLCIYCCWDEIEFVTNLGKPKS